MMRRKIRSNGIAPTPTDAILESISDGVFTVDLEWRITSFNRAAEEITGIMLYGESIRRANTSWPGENA